MQLWISCSSALSCHAASFDPGSPGEGVNVSSMRSSGISPPYNIIISMNAETAKD